jgi:hypothetical protein
MIESESEYNPTQVWWVEVKTKKGEKGWILYQGNGSISRADYLELYGCEKKEATVPGSISGTSHIDQVKLLIFKDSQFS